MIELNPIPIEKIWQRAEKFALDQTVQQLEWLVNADRARRQNRKARYAARGLWVRAILAMRSQDWPESFAESAEHLSDYQYWRVLSRVWLKNTVPNSKRELWLRLLKAPRPGIEAFARFPNSEPCRMFYALPSPILCYRGYGLKRENRESFHFSLDPSVAYDYAQRYGDEGHVYRIWLPKRDCVWFGGECVEIVHVPGLGDVREKMQGQLP
jgi:hypothetical protein